MSAGPRKFQLVLVDDDDVEALILARYLRDARDDIELTVFPSGPAFLEYMEAIKGDESVPRPDLVLLDVRMPRLSGFDVLSKLRSDPAYSEEPPIYMFSNSRDDCDAKRASELGASGYRAKPTGSEEYTEFLSSIGPGAV